MKVMLSKQNITELMLTKDELKGNLLLFFSFISNNWNCIWLLIDTNSNKRLSQFLSQKFEKEVRVDNKEDIVFHIKNSKSRFNPDELIMQDRK